MLGDSDSFSTQKNIKKDNGKLFSEKHCSDVKIYPIFKFPGVYEQIIFLKNQKKINL